MTLGTYCNLFVAGASLAIVSWLDAYLSLGFNLSIFDSTVYFSLVFIGLEVMHIRRELRK